MFFFILSSSIHAGYPAIYPETFALKPASILIISEQIRSNITLMS